MCDWEHRFWRWSECKQGFTPKNNRRMITAAAAAAGNINEE